MEILCRGIHCDGMLAAIPSNQRWQIQSDAVSTDKPVTKLVQIQIKKGYAGYPCHLLQVPWWPCIHRVSELSRVRIGFS